MPRKVESSGAVQSVPDRSLGGAKTGGLYIGAAGQVEWEKHWAVGRTTGTEAQFFMRRR
jgi:hypothetical protein